MGVTVVSGGGASLSVGQAWDLVVAATNPEVIPTVTVTPPDGIDVQLAVEPGGWVWFTASYVTNQPGVHVAVIDGGGTGSAAAAANVVAVSGGRPDVAALDEYLGDHSASDEKLADVLAAETQAQWDVCRVPAAYPDSLRQALLRRCARNLALQGLPLAVLQGDADGGSTILPGRDPEVRRLEGPYRRLKVG